jgi:sulfur relay protein TusB/DsrH
MTLHCLYRLPPAPTALACLDRLAPTDTLLLLGSAVLLARPQHPQQAPWLLSGARLCALEEDCAAHGIRERSPHIEAVSYAGWVTLTETHRLQQVWR